MKKCLCVLWLAFIVCFLSESVFSSADNDFKVKDAWSKSEKDTKTESGIPPVIVDNFDVGRTQGVFYERKNTLGIYQGTCAKRPAWSIITKSAEHRLGNKGYGLRLEWENSAGWCGWYTLLGDLDVTDYNALTFWVKGEKGGERFDIGLKDVQTQDLDIDAKYFGPVSLFLEYDVTTEWQKVVVPLSILAADVDLSSLGALVFWCRYSSNGTSSVVYLEDIMFEYDLDVRAREEYNAPKAEFDPDYPRAIWVWKIDPVIHLGARQEMFDLCMRAAIRKCYVYFGDFDENDDPNYTKQLEEFLREANELGIKIEILTGNPKWTLRENHHLAYNWLKSFLEYNKSRPNELRLAGCYLDIGPYLNDGWLTRREQLKEEYLELLAKLRELIDNYPDQNFELGGIIPTFYKYEGDYEEKILGYLDYATIAIFHTSHQRLIDDSMFHIDLAKQLGKKVYIGIETQDLVTMSSGRRSSTFYEEGWEEMESVVKKVEDTLRGNTGYAGIGIHCYYSYKSLQRGPKVPLKVRSNPDKLDQFISNYQQGSIKIDGDLSDWILSDPVELDNKNQVFFGPDTWNGLDDYSISAYSMWDSDNLYLAFVVIDDKLVQEKSKLDMWEGDHLEFWLDVDLLEDYKVPINNKDDFKFGFSPGNFDTIKPEVYLFIPEYPEHFILDNTEIAANRTDNGYIIEVRINACIFREIDLNKAYQTKGDEKDVVSQDSGQFRFYEGMRMGYSLEGSDCDDPKEPQKLMISTSKERVWGDPTTFNVIRLKNPSKIKQ